ncbi:52 kDa repressor of the inhibitor of the protein kinase-like [Mizuhopecten yessoensis]|uniref:52 kDa repressor of the inhibitor of the protein kinase-like n=1 Tax=Mizuhopecten yessoensis TaxID=6573 RepID=UPI000B4589DC|nr:52 kDa repressor of the inhibitor of the protein kinase-like [Mizuhopecten yessoensis]
MFSNNTWRQERTDPYSNQEILSVCLRLLTGRRPRVRELFFNFVYLERATGESIAHAITECLRQNHIDISQARVQSYDGAACMSSAKMGVQARIRQLSPRALYVHCNSHVLNLSIASACKQPAIRNMIDILNAVFLFFDLSPKRQRFLERILDNMAPTTRKKKLVGLCKTRWVERHTCFDTFYDMYGYLCECLEAILDPSGYPDIYMDTWTGSRDQETRTKAQALLASMCSSQTIIAFLVTKNALENVRPIASKLQKRDLDIHQAYGMIDQTKARIVTLRKDIEEEFSVWFEDATRLATLVGIPISAPRAPKSARQLHRLNAPSTTPSEYFLRNVAIPFCDHLSSEFANRFTPETRKDVEILALLPPNITKTEDVQKVVENLKFWEEDLPNPPTLRAEIKEWQRFWNTKMPMEPASSLNLVDCLDNADEDVFPNLNTLLRIGCILPVGSCEAERSFSCLRRLTTYLRNRMGENRLTGLALMNMNHDIDIGLDKVCQAFIQRHIRKMFAGCILSQ